MNQDIENLFLTRLNEYQNDSTNLLRDLYKLRIIGQSNFSIGNVLDAFDNHFEELPESLNFIEVSYENPESIKLLCEFYAEIYLNVFPDPNERESLDNMLDYLKKKQLGWYAENNYHILLLANKETNEIIGGSILDYLKKPNCGVIEFITVRKEYRGKGYGETIYKETLEVLRKDAAKTKNKSLDWVICEVNNPKETDMRLESMDPNVRLQFWEKLNFRILNFQYFQPALSEDKEPVRNLLLLSNILNPDWENSKVPSKILAEAICEYARLAMRIPEPHSNHIITQMLHELNREENVNIIPIRAVSNEETVEIPKEIFIDINA